MEKKNQKPRSKFGRRFDEEFKRDAVSMLESRVRPAERLAGELGVSVWSLKRWAKLYGKDSAADGPPGGGGPAAADAAVEVESLLRVVQALAGIRERAEVCKAERQ